MFRKAFSTGGGHMKKKKLLLWGIDWETFAVGVRIHRNTPYHSGPILEINLLMIKAYMKIRRNT